jgi:hypothetical protein
VLLVGIVIVDEMMVVVNVVLKEKKIFFLKPIKDILNYLRCGY